MSEVGVIVNRYTTLAENAPSGASSIVLGSVAALADGADALEPGDLLLLIQMQGATLDTSDTASSGSVVALGSAGSYELACVQSVTPATDSVLLSQALASSYVAGGITQVVRVPQYTTLTISAGASVVAPAWDGATGGIVALSAAQAIALSGAIDVSGCGFRGGPADNDSSDPSVAYWGYRSSSSSDGARKGEGIGGFSGVNPYGRGAAANGGGGGNAFNAGGGGGANGHNGEAWTGQGVFDGTATGAAAWHLDPGYVANGNQLATSAGGGRGGYSYSDANQDALGVGPGTASWSGNQRREIGGLGGRSLDSDPAARLFFGGGGGAGDGNNSHAGAGGAGGGMVIIVARQVVGTGGKVLANGDDGLPADSSSGDPGGDGAGGGGGGGTVIIQALSIEGVSVEARGGAGGAQAVDNGNDADGPGGGGGGGYVAVSTSVTVDIGGGPGGITSSPALAEFPCNGASNGNSGQMLISTALKIPGS